MNIEYVKFMATIVAIKRDIEAMGQLPYARRLELWGERIVSHGLQDYRMFGKPVKDNPPSAWASTPA